MKMLVFLVNFHRELGLDGCQKKVSNFWVASLFPSAVGRLALAPNPGAQLCRLHCSTHNGHKGHVCTDYQIRPLYEQIDIVMFQVPVASATPMHRASHSPCPAVPCPLSTARGSAKLIECCRQCRLRDFYFRTRCQAETMARPSRRPDLQYLGALCLLLSSCFFFFCSKLELTHRTMSHGRWFCSFWPSFWTKTDH